MMTAEEFFNFYSELCPFEEGPSDENYTIITLKEFFKMKEEKEFVPVVGKKYYFTDIEDNNNLSKNNIRVFLGMSLDKQYIAQFNESYNVDKWKYCFPIPEELELTLEEIAEKFNVSVEQLKIKK